MKNLFKTLTVLSLLSMVSASFTETSFVTTSIAATSSAKNTSAKAKDRDFRQQKSEQKVATQDDNLLPEALQEILLESKPLDGVSADTSSNDNTYFSSMQGESSTTSSSDNEIKPFASKITFTNIGSPKGIEIYPGQKSAGISFTLPIDKVITSAKLELYVSMTEAMQDTTNHIDVKVNGQALGSLPVASTEITNYELDIPAEFLAQDNSITLDMADDDFVCKIDYSGKQKIVIDPESFLSVGGYNLELGSDLSLFPLPFFDKYNSGTTLINFVLPKNSTSDTIYGSLMLASYFGTIADYRTVKFNVAHDTLPLDNAIVFAHPGQTVAGIDMPQKEGIYIKDHPYSKPYKNIFIVAKNKSSFIKAVYSLVNAKLSTATDYLKIKNDKPELREAYDAPFWIPSNKKVYLSSLLKKNQSLVTHGYTHGPLNITFKAAPDLYQLYEDSGDLYVAYEFPLDKNIDENESGLNLLLSGAFLDKLPVNKKGLLENIWRLSGGDAREDKRHVQISPNMIYGDNNLELYFDLRLKPNTPCSVISDPNVKSVIDESSYIDLSKTKHFARLPNLSYYVGASFPFTRYSDFSHTAVLLPDDPSIVELNTLMNMVARAGTSTGSLVSAEQVVIGSDLFLKDPEFFEDKDLLIVSNLSHKDYLSKLFDGSAFTFNGNELNIYDYGLISFRGGFFRGLRRFLSGDFRAENVDANRYVRTSLAWRGFLSFLSPFDSDKIAVVVTATDDEELEKLTDDLANSNVNRSVRGDITLISGLNKVMSFNVGDYIFSGNVSTSFKILTFAGEHVIWLCISSFIVLILLSYIISKYLQRRSRARLLENDVKDNNKMI
ncbi:MAG: cellulose biosynthesis cyclic di-GMP-binding regulatory protein BcsB [Succinivibrio sp.]|nr:cellulose biosynthesis cyclic di-GMP-binding regulatory protein BcsB [Succinivibrio sp.]